MGDSAKHVLIIDDEPGLQLTLEDRLRAEGYSVEAADNGMEGETAILQGRHDLILLDVMMPGKDGFTVCQNIRKAGITTPILMLTARNTNIDTVMGLRVGADDYLAKPFDMQVLLARMEALLRRTASAPVQAAPPPSQESREIEFGHFRLNRETGLLENLSTDPPEMIELNAQEYKLLEYLLLHRGRILSRNTILDEVWGYENEVSTRTVDVHIAKLRHRLGESDRPRHIITYRGRGYYMNKPD